jgi:putative CocE/NonD family hydrolase
MRDGVLLFTAIYTPDDASKSYPILLSRTPYSCAPYGEGKREHLGPSELFEHAGYIFAYQDVRGCFLSEGEFVNMRPEIDHKLKPGDVDESSDTWDTIDWLVKNLPESNGKVGMWGISYPGFYAAAGMIDAHPALRAVSPQAPIADWFFDDFRHHGAIWLPHGFNFLANFGHVRTGPTTERPPRFEHGTQDGYQFSSTSARSRTPTRATSRAGSRTERDPDHPNRDAYWQARDVRPHLEPRGAGGAHRRRLVRRRGPARLAEDLPRGRAA